MEETRLAPYFNGEDRISRLPNEIIHYILSGVGTKSAVQTCVLSKRWIDVWKSLPFLYFSRSSFPKDKQHSFVMFVDMVLNFHKEIDIQRFTVYWPNSFHDTSVMMNVNRWIVQAVKYNVQNITISITQCREFTYEITPNLLNCKSLKKLKLVVARAEIILPGSMNLPQLKVMYFEGLSISDVESSKRLFSSCPVLEKLRLVNCDIQTDNQRNLIVDSPSLKKFVYTNTRKHSSFWGSFFEDHTMAIVIKLCAPNLEIFTLRSLFAQNYSLENCCPQLKVRLFMKLMTKEEDENAERYSNLPSMEKEVYATRMMKLVGAVCMVKAMRLSPGFLEVLSQAPELLDSEPPCLQNLQRLTLQMWFTRGSMRALAYLVKISPNITHIYLESMESNFEDVGDGWEARLSTPGMLSRLKCVLINQVEGCGNELKFLRFLLQNAVALKNIMLYPRPTIESPDKVGDEFIDKLSALPRASSRILIHWAATESTHLIYKKLTTNTNEKDNLIKSFSCEI